MVGISNDSIELTPFNRAIKYDKEVNTKLLDTIHILFVANLDLQGFKNLEGLNLIEINHHLFEELLF